MGVPGPVLEGVGGGEFGLCSGWVGRVIGGFREPVPESSSEVSFVF